MKELYPLCSLLQMVWEMNSRAYVMFSCFPHWPSRFLGVYLGVFMLCWIPSAHPASRVLGACAISPAV